MFSYKNIWIISKKCSIIKQISKGVSCLVKFELWKKMRIKK